VLIDCEAIDLAPKVNRSSTAQNTYSGIASMKRRLREIDQTSVRPEASTPRSHLAKLLNGTRAVLGGDRFENLYRSLADQIRSIEELRHAKIKLLDYGCGVMSFSERLLNDGVIDSFIGVDIFPTPNSPDKTTEEKWSSYRQIPDAGIDKSLGTFDLAIVTDVLHHANPDERAKILRTLSVISRFILVKDHFEYGAISRQLLRLADWYGNYAYGVNVPDRYFDQKSWKDLIEKAGLHEVKLTTGVIVHRGIFGLLIPPRYHFLSLLTRQSK
jgi:hypothetical protein